MGLSSGVGGIAGGIESIFSGFDKAKAATQAGQIQSNSAQQGINTINGLLGNQQANQNPFIQGGQQSFAQLMQGLQSGQFQNGAAPQYQGGAFQAPTLAQAEQAPGYQFAQQQGSKGILQGAAAAGGAISGGTLKALGNYNQGLATQNYGNVFNQALSTYGAGLQQYQAQLQGYGAQVQGNQANVNQLLAPAQLGEQAAGSLNGTETTQGENLASEFNNQGNAQAAALIAATNQKWGGIQAGTNQILGGGGGGGQGYGQGGGYQGYGGGGFGGGYGGFNTFGGLMSGGGFGGSYGGQNPMGGYGYGGGGGGSYGGQNPMGAPQGSVNSTFNPVSEPDWTSGLSGGGIG